MFETLLLVGIACVIAAVAGGGVKLFNVETPAIHSLWRQAGLATVGLAIIAADVAFTDRATSQSSLLPTTNETTLLSTTPDTTPATTNTPTSTRRASKPNRRIPASGTYAGVASQRGSRATTNKNYAVSMTFSAGGSTITYRTLNCLGDLRPFGFDGRWRLYAERITRGGCDQGGTWRVRVSGPRQLEVAWASSTADYKVSGILAR